MGKITTDAAETYRDNEIVGLPASGEHDPKKSEIRALWASTDAALSAVANGVLAGGAIIYEVRGSAGQPGTLFGDLAHAAGTLGLVYDDPIPSRNGFYVKAGASGVGNWLQTDLALPSSFADLLSALDGKVIKTPGAEPGYALPTAESMKGRFLIGNAMTGRIDTSAGVTDLTGSGEPGAYTATGGETSIAVGFPVDLAWLLRFKRNNVLQDPETDYQADGSSSITISTPATAGETFKWVQIGGLSAAAFPTNIFRNVGSAAVARNYQDVFRETVRLLDYKQTADGDDHFPAYERIRSQFAGGAVEIILPRGDIAFSQPLTDDGFEVCLSGPGYDFARLLFPSALETWIALGVGDDESRNCRLMGFTIASQDDDDPPAGSVGIYWSKFNYGYEEDVRVMQRAIGRKWNHNGGSTSIRYQSWGCATDTCSEAYEDFGEVAGVYIFNHEYGRNSGEAYDVADAMIRFRGGANDITHTDSQLLPRGPDVERPNLLRFTEIVGATGIFNFNNCVTENVRYGAAIDPGVTVTALNINGGRYAPVAEDFFLWGDEDSRVQYSTFRPSQISNHFNLVNPYRCYVSGQFAAISLTGGSGASVAAYVDVSGQLALTDSWDRLSVQGAVGSISDTATGTGVSIFVAGYVRLPGLPTSSAGLMSGRIWRDTAADNVLKVIP